MRPAALTRFSDGYLAAVQLVHLVHRRILTTSKQDRRGHGPLL
jgi:hypothetical protein